MLSCHLQGALWPPISKSDPNKIYDRVSSEAEFPNHMALACPCWRSGLLSGWLADSDVFLDLINGRCQILL